MCLFPLGGGGGCFNMQPVVPPSQAALKHKQILTVVMIVHLVLALTFFLLTFSGGLQDLMLVLILFCASRQMHFCHLIIYMMFCMYNWIGYVCAIGLLI